MSVSTYIGEPNLDSIQDFLVQENAPGKYSENTVTII